MAQSVCLCLFVCRFIQWIFRFLTVQRRLQRICVESKPTWTLLAWAQPLVTACVARRRATRSRPSSNGLKTQVQKHRISLFKKANPKVSVSQKDYTASILTLFLLHATSYLSVFQVWVYLLSFKILSSIFVIQAINRAALTQTIYVCVCFKQ